MRLPVPTADRSRTQTGKMAYKDLQENEKNSDRYEADRILSLIDAGSASIACVGEAQKDAGKAVEPLLSPTVITQNKPKWWL